MKTISVVTSTGTSQGDRVLGGVFGTTQAQAEGEEGLPIFTIAPELLRVSQIFQMLEAGSAPVTPSSFGTIEVEDEDEHLVRAQLLHTLAIRWAQLYAGVNPGVPGLLGNVLNGESAKVAQNSKNHLLSMGMRSFMVPVSFKASAEIPGEYVADERELLQYLARNPIGNIVLRQDEEPIDCGTDLLCVGMTAPSADQLPEPRGQEDALAPAWKGFSGIRADVAGTMLVAAPDRERAKRIAKLILESGTTPEGRRILPIEITPEAITQVENMDLVRSEGSDDFEDSGYDRDI